MLLPPPPQQQQQPGAAAIPIHVLLDYENVQPDAAELRRLVPEFSHLWVFHGPHQRDVGKRFVSFGNSVTAVPISKPGKNALDFHLSFYMGYIASRNPKASMVVVANDKGYDPMLEHAGDLRFSVRRQAYGVAIASEPSPPRARTERRWSPISYPRSMA